MSLITPLKKARGLGSAKDGTHHWWMQRVTAIALVPLTLWMVFFVVSLSGEPYETVIAAFSSPFNVAMLSLFLFSAFYHASLGLQVVIEDYVNHEGLKLGSIVGMKFALALTGIMSIFAVIRTAFGS